MRVTELNRDTAPEAVDAVFEGLSARSRYLRFHSPTPRLTASARRVLTDVDGERHGAVCATVGGDPIGIARVIKTGECGAEIAVAVIDLWQRRGVGRLLLEELTSIAARMGVAELHGNVLPDNRAMLALVRKVLPGVRLTREVDTIELSYPLAWVTAEISDADLVESLQGI
ncbi:GNAT family N-acetyltransferase [Lentzea sp. BCCO 10_0798]|jgi:GNAT superfamily N-acetyltransferase|uniref:GNAT family N-acetyltransferase n=1 Tax=Lentzea kristufekii TaxID=3095430 RepID=A0ABU4TI09_9PSEU|nr:GNAT family N-acetyltransferase [Lentzea sp. BCCO 10_0798]MDX8047899.1 GNAT family N-acetyltransferase [Lentzea sp. BCCO 10_0798]